MAVLGTKFPALPLFPTTNLGTIMDIISKVLSEMLYLPAYLCSGGFLRIFIIIRSKKIGRVKDVDSFQSVILLYLWCIHPVNLCSDEYLWSPQTGDIRKWMMMMNNGKTIF